MSKNGRRIRTAEQNKKKEFRQMISFLLCAALMLFFLLVEVRYQVPEYEQLEQFNGSYQCLERRRSGRRRNNAFGLVLEDESSFYIHENFDRNAFEAKVKLGEGLIILADTDRNYLIHRTNEPVVYELTTQSGEKLRSYEETLVYMKQQKGTKSTALTVILFVEIGLAVVSFRNWRKYDKMIREHRERKKA